MTKDQRAAFIEFVKDESRSALAILGAACSILRVSGTPDQRRIANAVHTAVATEIEKMKVEANER